MSPGFSPRRHQTGSCGPGKAEGPQGRAGSAGAPPPNTPCCPALGPPGPKLPRLVPGAWCGASLTWRLGLKASKFPPVPLPQLLTPGRPSPAQGGPRPGWHRAATQVLRDCRPRPHLLAFPCLSAKLDRTPSPGGEGARAQAGGPGRGYLRVDLACAGSPSLSPPTKWPSPGRPGGGGGGLQSRCRG